MYCIGDRYLTIDDDKVLFTRLNIEDASINCHACMGDIALSIYCKLKFLSINFKRFRFRLRKIYNFESLYVEGHLRLNL